MLPFLVFPFFGIREQLTYVDWGILTLTVSAQWPPQKAAKSQLFWCGTFFKMSGQKYHHRLEKTFDR
jgi:hypothetical protein